MINEIYLSAVSAWEIGRQYALGRLALPQRPQVFVPAGRQGCNIRVFEAYPVRLLW